MQLRLHYVLARDKLCGPEVDAYLSLSWVFHISHLKGVTCDLFSLKQVDISCNTRQKHTLLTFGSQN